MRMTSNTTPPPFVASASSVAAPSTQPWCAFSSDGDESDILQWASGFPAAWLQMDFGAGAEIRLTRYTLFFLEVFFPNRIPKDWTIQGSNDQSDWGLNILDTRVNQIVNVHVTQRIRTTYECNGDPVLLSSPWRYLRMDITENNGGDVSIVTEWIFGHNRSRVY